jgi:HEPN domain
MPKKKPPFECTRQFFRAAVQRHEEARILFDNSAYHLAAVYLGGYAVECALKAVLLAHTPPKDHRETKATFRGAVAHNFDWLRSQLRKRKVNVPVDVSRQIGNVDWWSTDLRYRTGHLDREVAEDFLEAVAIVLAWVGRSA